MVLANLKKKKKKLKIKKKTPPKLENLGLSGP